MQIFSLREGRSFIMNFHHEKKSTKEIQFIAFSKKLSPFKMFISNGNESPSSQNSIEIQPSWLGGYSAIVDKTSKNWCEDCTYKILLEAERGSNEIFLMVRYEDTIHQISNKNFENIYASLNPRKMHCYSLEISEEKKAENLIIETILFSGSAKLAMNPWTNPIIDKQNLENNVFKTSEDINMENISIITPEQRQYGKTGNLNY